MRYVVCVVMYKFHTLLRCCTPIIIYRRRFRRWGKARKMLKRLRQYHGRFATCYTQDAQGL